MFCPVCKSEYREGFTKCSDCGVDVVKQLADDSEAKEVLWAGQDARVRIAICDKLDAAKILHEDDSVESQFMPAFRQSIYRIQIRKKDHEAALDAIRDIYVDQPNVRQSPGLVLDRNSDWLRTAVGQRDIWGRVIGYDPRSSESSSESEVAANTLASSNADLSSEEVSDDQLENFNPDDATSQVWSGADGSMAQSINVCLREVGIGCVVNETQGNFNVCVERASEIWAKEIIREIIEQTPPE
jgi:uncharacterized Zn finger protein (UPF0148 family)